MYGFGIKYLKINSIFISATIK